MGLKKNDERLMIGDEKIERMYGNEERGIGIE